jgi:hypothetical protein
LSNRKVDDSDTLSVTDSETQARTTAQTPGPGPPLLPTAYAASRHPGDVRAGGRTVCSLHRGAKTGALAMPAEPVSDFFVPSAKLALYSSRG